MRWYKATLFKLVDTGEVDETNKPVKREAEAGTAFFRKPPFKVSRDATEGNEHDYVSRTFLTRKNGACFSGVRSFEVLGVKYRLTGLSDLGAETMVTGRCSKCTLDSMT